MVKQRFTLKAIKDTGIIKKHSNGGRDQEIIWKTPYGEKFRVLIHCESYDFQSYARLYKWNETNNEWNIVSLSQPQRDYKIDISYSNSYPLTAFQPIINDFKKLAKEFASIPVNEKRKEE